MAMKLDTLDYLLQPVAAPAPLTSTVTVLDDATLAFGGYVLKELQNAPAKRANAFDLVDKTGINIEVLHRVLDTLATKKHWVTVDKSDPRGNYVVTLLPEGQAFLGATR
jgi:hypothetical protein